MLNCQTPIQPNQLKFIPAPEQIQSSEKKARAGNVTRLPQGQEENEQESVETKQKPQTQKPQTQGHRPEIVSDPKNTDDWLKQHNIQTGKVQLVQMHVDNGVEGICNVVAPQSASTQPQENVATDTYDWGDLGKDIGKGLFLGLKFGGKALLGLCKVLGYSLYYGGKFIFLILKGIGKILPALCEMAAKLS